ncbi:MAG: general secretion pathway protein GspB [Pseudomonadales bacterium]
MSYILQAQRRDEAAIDPDAAAQLVVAEDRQGRRRWALWLIGLALLANVLIIGYLFGPWSDGSSGASGSGKLSKPQAARELVVKPRERTGPTQRSATDRPSRTAPTRAPLAKRIAPTQPSVASTASTASSEPSKPTASASTKGRVLSPEEAAQLNIDLPTEPATSNVPAPAPAPTADIGPLAEEQPAQASTATAKPEVKAPVSSSAKKPIKLADLSPEDRADFPELEFSTHVFADDPALRAVVVNARRLSEGESIGEMVLRAVTEDGIIVDYRGQRVAVSVVDTWK